jgi:hypothetical protein
MKKKVKKVKKENTGGVPVGGGCTASFSFSIGFAPVELPPLDELPILAELNLSESEFALWVHLGFKYDLFLSDGGLHEIVKLCRAIIAEETKAQTEKVTPPPQSDKSEKEGVTTITEHHERFDEYGTAWEDEVMKLPKAVLLSMLSDDTKKRCSEMLDGNESKMYLMRILKSQVLESKSTKA